VRHPGRLDGARRQGAQGHRGEDARPDVPARRGDDPLRAARPRHVGRRQGRLLRPQDELAARQALPLRRRRGRTPRAGELPLRLLSLPQSHAGAGRHQRPAERREAHQADGRGPRAAHRQGRAQRGVRSGRLQGRSPGDRLRPAAAGGALRDRADPRGAKRPRQGGRPALRAEGLPLGAHAGRAKHEGLPAVHAHRAGPGRQDAQDRPAHARAQRRRPVGPGDGRVGPHGHRQAHPRGAHAVRGELRREGGEGGAQAAADRLGLAAPGRHTERLLAGSGPLHVEEHVGLRRHGEGGAAHRPDGRQGASRADAGDPLPRRGGSSSACSRRPSSRGWSSPARGSTGGATAICAIGTHCSGQTSTGWPAATAAASTRPAGICTSGR